MNACDSARELVPDGTQAVRPDPAEDANWNRRIPSSIPLTKPSQYLRWIRPFAVRLLEAQNVNSCLASICCGKTVSSSPVDAVAESDASNVAHKAIDADLIVVPLDGAKLTVG